MDIEIDKSRLNPKDIIKPVGGEVRISIPITCKDKKGKGIKHYRIDKIEVICDNETENPRKRFGKKILRRIAIWKGKKESQCSGKTKWITEFKTPETTKEGTGSVMGEKTTQILNQENFCCEAIVTGKNSIKELKTQKKCIMDLALLPENGDDLKQKITFDVKDELDVKIGGTSKHSFLFLNIILFTLTAIALSLWNLFINHDAYGQPVIIKDSWISVGIGLLFGYFGISIIKLVVSLARTPGDYPALRKYPELFFEKDFIIKMKNKSHFVVLAVVCVIAIFIISFFSPISLPSVPSEQFTYYDSTSDREIDHSRVYRWNYSNIRIGINKNKLQDKEFFYVAGLKLDKKGYLIPQYYEFIIEDSLESKRTVLSFKDIGGGMELEENQEYVYNDIYGKKSRDDGIRVRFDGGLKFSVIHVPYIAKDNLEKRLKKFYKLLSTKNVDMSTFATEKDKRLCSYKEELFKSFGEKTIREEELLAVSEFHMKKMDKSPDNDIKRLALVCYQLHASVGFGIKLNSNQIERILEIFEFYYRKSNIKSLSHINGKITQMYFRALLYLEKNFAEDAYRKIHNSIARVLDNSGGEYYLYYLEECVRNNVLHGSYVDSSEEDFLRIAYFKKKIQTFRILEKSKSELKRIYSLNEADQRSKDFINNLIERLTLKPSIEKDTREAGEDISGQTDIPAARDPLNAARVPF